MENHSWKEKGITATRRRLLNLVDQLITQRREPREADWEKLKLYVLMCRELKAMDPAEADDEVLDKIESSACPELEEETPETATSPPSISDYRFDPNARVGRFERLLRGGRIHFPNGEWLNIGEGLTNGDAIPGLWFGHNDLVEVKQVGYLGPGRPRYHFKILERVDDPVPNRQEALAIIRDRYDSYLFKVELLGRNQTLLVKANDVEYHQAFTGDVITVAYWANELASGEAIGDILWRHESKEDDELPPPARSGPKPRTESESAKEETAASTEPLPAFLEAPRILVVGGQNWPSYREGIASMRAVPRHVEADERVTYGRARELISGSDIVLLVTQYGPHKVFDQFSRAAKSLNHRHLYYANSENWAGLARQLAEIAEEWNQEIAETG